MNTAYVAAGYRILRKLGGGGYGVVFEAEHGATGERRAIKFLRRETGDLTRFSREIQQVIAQQPNQCVVKVLEAQLEGPTPFFVMELCEGSLRDYVAKLAWRDVAGALSQVLLGLSALYERGGFHRDLKPDNILVSRTSEGDELCKVSDFGLARDPSVSSPITRSAWGTQGYMAPEILAGSPYTSAADVYSLGIIAIELMTGAQDPDAVQFMDAPPTFVELVRSMVASESSRRPGVLSIGGKLTRLLAPPPPLPQQAAKDPDAAARALGAVALVGLGIWALTKLFENAPAGAPAPGVAVAPRQRIKPVR